MSKSNVQIVQEYVEEVINQKRFDRALDYFTEDCVFRAAPYVGIGVDFAEQAGDKLVLADIAPNGPAAGKLEIGDEIVCVSDGVKTWDTFKELKGVEWGRGMTGTTFTMTVNRGGTLMEIPLTRGRVEGFDAVFSKVIDRWKDFTLKYWPDMKLEIQQIFGAGDLVAYFSVVNGTNQEYHRSAVWSECGIYRLKDGKIVEAWGVEDAFSQMKQLGYQISDPATESAA